MKYEGNNPRANNKGIPIKSPDRCVTESALPEIHYIINNISTYLNSNHKDSTKKNYPEKIEPTEWGAEMRIRVHQKSVRTKITSDTQSVQNGHD